MTGSEGSSALTKTEYSADSLSRSYLEHQRAYYEGLKPGGGYPGYPGDSQGGQRHGDTENLSGRQSVESPDIKKTASITPDPAQALQVGQKTNKWINTSHIKQKHNNNHYIINTDM